MRRSIARWHVTLPAGLALACAATPEEPAARPDEPARLALVATWRSGAKGGTEILSVQQSTARVAVTRSEEHAVTVLDLADPLRPRRVADHPLPEGGGELTAVGFHPELDVVLAIVRGKRPDERGRVHALDATTGALLASAETGYEPDAVAIDPAGKLAAIPDEGESFWHDPQRRELRSSPGSVTFVELDGLPEALVVHTVELPDLAQHGIVAPSQRWIERPVDLDGSGTIDAPLDLDGDGETTGQVEIAAHGGRSVTVAEESGEGALMVPLSATDAELVEPEYVAFSPDGGVLYVTLQENNAMAVFDARERKLLAVWDLGSSEHPADRTEDGRVSFTETLRALREPDGVALTPDGRYAVTADEGDTEPGASSTPAGQPTGGSRTVSVFDAMTGELLGDTGNQIDAAAHAAGAYPEARSDSKGAEPENLVVFAAGGVAYAAVTLERASAVALVSLRDPRAPRVLGVTRLADDSVAPEGVALFVKGERIFVLTANEVSGDVSVLEFLGR